MSHRDAYHRAERAASGGDPLERVEALTNLLERAEHTGDGQQADAVYHLALERSHFGVADAYRKTRPKAKERWDKYSAARQEKESLGNRLFGWAGPQKPPQLIGAVLPGEGFAEAR
jgi:hypothetical protein